MKRKLPLVEEMEKRTLLSAITVLTHGGLLSSLPGWVSDMATAINDRAGYGCTPGQIENSRVRLSAIPSLPADGPEPNRCQALLLFDWSELSSDPGVANEDRVAGRFADVLHTLLSSEQEQVDLQFIGHSRGTYVNAEVIRRLAAMGDGSRIGFLQMASSSDVALRCLFVEKIGSVLTTVWTRLAVFISTFLLSSQPRLKRGTGCYADQCWFAYSVGPRKTR